MPPENENQNIDTVEQADDLLASIDTPENQPIQDAPPAPATLPDEFDFPIEDKKTIRAKREQVFQWAQQGRTAPTHISKLTQELNAVKKRLTDEEPKWKSLEQKYGEIDAYVRQNPQFWDHVTQSFQNKNQSLQDQSNPLASVVNDLQSQLRDVLQWKNQTLEERQKNQVAQEDKQYLSELDEIRKAYPQFDFVTPDDEGKTLELRVLEHMQQNKIGNFRAGLRDFKHDELVKLAAEQAKENLSKEKQKQTKLGILGISAQPTKRASSDHRGKSYEQLASEIKDEFKLA